VICTLGFVILLELLPQAVKLHPHSSVLRWIETRLPPQGFDCDSVLRKVSSIIFKMTVADILENLGKVLGSAEDCRGEDRLQFLFFFAELGLSGHLNLQFDITTGEFGISTGL
jgi:hypothetical protein